MLDERILKNDEKAVYCLRSLYSSFGYSRYKMSKFEEYDLYVKNKDFLISDGIITFTDTNGRLLALKPDVTLSIIKNAKDEKGAVEKLYYNENVYRISGDSHCFKEITQTGLECIGDISLYDICEVLYLAVRSLEKIDESFIIDVSHAGLVSALIGECQLSQNVRGSVLEAIRNKSMSEIEAIFSCGNITERAYAIISKLMTGYESCEGLLAAFSEYGEKVRDCLQEFAAICNSVKSLGCSDKIKFDFSIVDDMSYYSGIVFKGYIAGIPQSVLSGGQYDKLMRKMGKSSGAIGFAVYLDTLERHKTEKPDFDYDYVLMADDNIPAEKVIKAVEELSQKGESVIVLKSLPSSVKCKKLIKLTDKGLEEA